MKKLALLGVLAVILFLGCPGSKVTTITVTPAADTTGIGLTAQFTATAYDADGGVISDVTFTWSSSSAATATVDDDGLATGVATGSCTITAASDDVEGTATLVITTGPTHHSGAITADETWYPSGNPHIIDNDVWTENNATLTILPGCVVKFEPGTELYTGYSSTAGAIVANGKADTTIIFTSNATSPSPGDWAGISLWDNAMNTCSFSYCTIEYAGMGAVYGSFYATGINYVKINNCTIQHSGSNAVVFHSSAGFTSFTNNTITDCTGYPLSIGGEFVRTIGSGNTFTSNTTNAIYVLGAIIHTSGTWINPGVPYVIGGDIDIADNNTNPVLTIAAGNTIKFQPGYEMYCGYSESGGLIADGTAGRITFTSNVPSPSPGDFQDIGFWDNTIATSKLVNCNILYAGGYYGNVYINASMPEIRGDSIGYSETWGISLNGATHPDRDSLLAHNTFFNNTLGDVSP